MLALGKRRGDYFIRVKSNDFYFCLGRSDVFADKNLYLYFENSFIWRETATFELLENYGLDYDNFFNYLKNKDAHHHMTIELYDSDEKDIVKDEDFIRHVDIKLTNDEIFDIAFEVYHESIKYIDFIMQAEYSSLEAFNEAQQKLSVAVASKYNIEILKLTKSFNGSYEDYKKYVASINRKKAKELVYYSKCLRSKEATKAMLRKELECL